MAAFDFVDYVGHAYRFMWDERRALARLAAVPLAVKLGCYLAIEALGYQEAIIRHALLMLPSYFLDGWMLSYVARFALFDQRWPDRKRFKEGTVDGQGGGGRTKGLVTGMATYVVARFLSMGVVALMVALMGMVSPETAVATGQAAAPAGPAAMKAQAFLAVLFVVYVSIWGFRLFWMFIPAAADVSIMGVLRRIKGYMISFYMIGTWLVMAVPLLLLFFLMSSLLALILGMGHGAASADVNAVMLVGSTFADTLTLIGTTYALSLALRPFMADVANKRQGAA